MTDFELYALTLSLIVFAILVGVFTFVVIAIMRQKLKLIGYGDEDGYILKEFGGEKRKPNKFWAVFSIVVNVVICVFFAVVFAVSLYVNCTECCKSDKLPTYRVVLSASMESKHEKNTYLVENNLNDQFSAFDLIATYKLPAEEDLQLYDIVVYEKDDMLIIHRIVGIEEPNEKHPNERHFLLQGDAVSSPDHFPVLYSQMKGIYRAERIPFVGSFVMFMQSPAGWLCMLLVVGVIVVSPILEKRLLVAYKARYALLAPQDTTIGGVDGTVVDEPFETVDEETVIEEITVENAVEEVTDEEVIEEQPTEDVDEQSADETVVGDAVEIADETVDTAADGAKTEETGNKKGNVVMLFDGFNDRKTFWEKYEQASVEMKQRYMEVVATLLRIEDVRVLEGKQHHTYKCKSAGVARLSFSGKTLSVALALDVEKYRGSKYVFDDLSAISKHKGYPMRLKATSERQTRWICQLIEQMAKDNSWAFAKKLKKTVVAVEIGVASDFDNGLDDAATLAKKSPFEHLKGQKGKSFEEKLSALPLAKARFDELESFILSIKGARKIVGRTQVTYKKGNLPVARMSVKGKTLNVYLGLEPSKYSGTKYVFRDASAVKKYAGYPMRVRATSDRQVKWIKELVSDIVKGGAGNE